jgi:hypothetical protein
LHPAHGSSLTFSSTHAPSNVQENSSKPETRAEPTDLPSRAEPSRAVPSQAKQREKRKRADYIHPRTMCHATTCRSCGLTTYAGCGRHIDSALHGVPEEKRCLGWASAGPRCPGPRTQPANDGKVAHTPARATTVTPGQSAHHAAGQRSAW